MVITSMVDPICSRHPEQILNLVAQLLVLRHLRVELIEKRVGVLIRQRLGHRAKNLHLFRRPILPGCRQ